MKKQLSRRIFIKGAFLSLASSVYGLSFSFLKSAPEKKISNRGKTLIIYFSQTGITKHMADHIHKIVGGDIIELKPVKPYIGTYKQLKIIAKKEQDMRYRPKIVDNIPDLSEYKTVFIGFPTWLYTMPMPLFTLLESRDFSGKNIVPFNTHGGTGFSESLDDMKIASPKAKIFNGLEILDEDISSSSKTYEIKNWLKKLGFSTIKGV